MLSSALMAVLIASSPAHPAEPARPVAPLTSACSAQLDRKFAYFVDKTPSEKGYPGFRLVAQTSKATPLAVDGASNCVSYLTRLDLVR